MKLSSTPVRWLTAICCSLIISPSVFAVPTNLALLPAATANASSIRDPIADSPDNAIDGLRSSRDAFNQELIWHSTASSNVPLGPATAFQSLWYEVDLGANFFLDRVEIFSRLGIAPNTVTTQFPASPQHLVKDFRIDVFNTAGTNVFTKNYLPTKSTDDEPWAADEMRNIVGSRVRITRDPRHRATGFADSAMSLAEFEIWGQETPILQNLAKSGTVTATAPNTFGIVTTPASRAIDGNLSGHFWHEGIYESSTTGGAPYNGPFGNGHYWQVELQQLSQINYVTIFARTDGEPAASQIVGGTWHGGNPDHRNGAIRISILGVNGTTVITSIDTTLGGDDGLMQRYDLTTLFESNPIGKIVRIESLDTTKTLSLGEVEVFGTPQGIGLSVPEPATGLALGFALLGSLATTRRRRRDVVPPSRVKGMLKVVVTIIAMGCGVVASQNAVALPTNLSIAPATVATASSNLAANSPSFAKDGVRNVPVANQFWHSTNNTADNFGIQHWYEVNLGSDFYLDRLEIFARNSNQDTVKNFRLEVYNNAGTTVFSQMFLTDGKTTGDRAWATDAFRNVVGSRVRIIRDPPHAQWDRAMTFAEFEVWGQSSPIPTNLALNRPTTSSTPLVDSGPTGPGLANDGNLGGHFWLESVFVTDGTTAPFTGPFGSGHFWQTQLAAPSAINYVTLFARSDDYTQNGPVRISIIGANGSTVVASADTTLGGLDSGLERFDVTQLFPTNPVGSFVRVEALDTNLKLALAEVEVFGPPPAVVGVPGDYNGNGTVDSADYVVWRNNNGLTGGATTAQGDGTGDGNVNAADYTYWRTRFGNTSGSGSSLGGAAVPEPAAAMIMLIGSVFVLPIRSRRMSS